MVFQLFLVNFETLRSRAGPSVWTQRHNHGAVLQPWETKAGGIEIIDHRDQGLLAGEGIQVNDHCLRRAIQPSRAIEKLAPQGADMTTYKVSIQFLGNIRHGIVDQGHQPANHLQRPPLKTRAFAIAAVLVVAARRRIHELVMYLHPKTLLLVLALAEVFQAILQRCVRGGEQRMPAVLFWPRPHFSTYNGADRLLVRLALQGRPRLGQANLFRWGSIANTRFRHRHEQAARQLFPTLESVRVATGPHG